MTGEPHRLTQVDKDQQLAVCSVCGPTTIRVRQGHGPECMTLRRAQRPQRRYPDTPATREKARWWRIANKYGISREDFEQMVARQKGRCAICRESPPGGTHLLVDHDHATGRVRGLLCRSCNLALGYLRDDPEIVRAVLDYLR